MDRALASPSFGDLLRDCRLARDLTQEALAERAGVSARTVQALERGEGRPLRDTVARLAAALELRADRLAAFRAVGQPAPRWRAAGGRTTTAGDVHTDADAPRPTLPMALTSFVGRERQMGEVRQLLERTRLIALTGTGGCGKTRLALEVAGSLVGHFPDGVWLVDLAPLTDPALVAQTVARCLGVREGSSGDVTSALVAALRVRRLLLLLDNCEHVLDACAGLVTALLCACPALRVLATSREALRVPGEVVWRVPSLTSPHVDSRTQAVDLEQYEAVRLFVERAAAAQPGFTLTDRNASAVAELCHRLDGLPLAIELAAARVTALPPEQLAARLDQRFRLLTGGSRAALPRLQTLRATLDWSYDLLDQPERQLFARLAVFGGGCTLEAAEGVGGGGDVSPEDVLGLLTALVDKSLVQAEVGGEEARYQLLETVRQYGRERLAASGEAETMRSRHARYYLALAERAAVGMTGPDRTASLVRLDRERDNLHAALKDSRSFPDGGATTVRLVHALARYWQERGYLRDGCWWTDLVLSLPATAAGSARVRALLAWASFAIWRGDADPRLRLEEALAIARGAGDRAAVARTLWTLGQAAVFRGDIASAWPLVEESVALSDELGDPVLRAQALYLLGNVARHGGDLSAARAAYAEALGLYRAAGDLLGIARITGHLGILALWEGDLRQARALMEDAVARHHQMGARVQVAIALNGLATIARAAGDRDQATRLAQEGLALNREVGEIGGIAWSLRLVAKLAPKDDGPGPVARLRESLALYRRKDDWRGIADGLAALASVAREAGDPARAARLLAAASALFQETGARPLPPDQTDLDIEIASARAALGEAAFAAAWREGEALGGERALAEALGSEEPILEQPVPDPTPAPPTPSDPLTPREREVAALVARLH